MGAMKNLLIAIEEECGRCKDVKGCENCKMRLDIGDKIVYVAGKTRKILGVDLKSELAKTGAFILSCMRVCLVVLMLSGQALAAEIIDVGKLADAIYLAEGGSKTSHAYGILAKYKHTTPRQACINTINSGIKRFNKQTREKDFIVFLSRTYCPIGALNDPNNLNVNWVKNVKYFYNRP